MKTRTAMRMIAISLGVLTTTVALPAQCRPPVFETGGVLVDSSSEIIMSISIPMQDFGPSRLICLAQSLRAIYSGRSTIIASVFASPWAASHSIGLLLGQEDSRDQIEAINQLHAVYVLDINRNEEYIKLIPLHEGGSHNETGPFDTRIDLPATTTPHCRLEVRNRCIMALDDLAYPYEALRQKVIGTVTLSAIISLQGTLHQVRVVNTAAIPPNGGAVLIKAAIKNLSSWHLEPATHSDFLQITYSYEIDDSLPRFSHPKIEWALPD